MKKQKEFKSRVYRLTRGAAPLSFMLPSKSSKRRPLLYFDEETGENREIRYATNQQSPFKDEQDGNAIVTPIIFESGLLRVPKQNQALQRFLAYHPLNGRKFEEVDTAKDAAREVESLNTEVDALIAAKQMDVEEMEAVGRVILKGDVTKMSSSELKRDILVYARNYPADFLQVIDDPALKLHSTIQKFFEEGLLSYRNKKKDVYFNLPSNKKRLVTIPFGEEPLHVLASYFKTDEGVEKLEYLEKQLS
jgi:hypothetical protein|tara:strand:- start:129 stop:875 length:747 start_codon:yes stop_codon:yes gene_type:complete